MIVICSVVLLPYLKPACSSLIHDDLNRIVETTFWRDIKQRSTQSRDSFNCRIIASVISRPDRHTVIRLRLQARRQACTLSRLRRQSAENSENVCPFPLLLVIGQAPVYLEDVCTICTMLYKLSYLHNIARSRPATVGYRVTQMSWARLAR